MGRLRPRAAMSVLATIPRRSDREGSTPACRKRQLLLPLGAGLALVTAFVLTLQLHASIKGAAADRALAALVVTGLCAVAGTALLGLFYIRLARMERRLLAISRKAIDEASLRETAQQKHVAVESQMRHESLHDSLTGLANRALFMDRLARCLHRSKRRADYHFAVLFIDLDGFKIINDGMGHSAGDRFLVGMGERLRQCLRGEDEIARALAGGEQAPQTLARLGGDEFTVLLEEIQSVENAVRVAQRIQKALAAPLELDGREVSTSVSIGITLNDAPTAKPEDLLREADTAMHRAKALGRSRCEVFDRAMHAQAIARLVLENDLRRAVEQQQFIVHYQPVVDLATGQIRSFEALVRWQHPQRGLLPPAEFIGVAEETGLIVPMGWLVLREACKQLRAWQQLAGERPLAIAVNISSHQLRRADFIEQIDSALRETGLSPQSLELEVTESVLMEHVPATMATLTQLRERGIGLHLDDFGTGYSSLSYLHRFPFDVVKIDRSFTANMNAEGTRAVIPETITLLAHHLKMKVIAEGVETAQQAAVLRDMGCEWGQGYYFCKPMPAGLIEPLLSAGDPRLPRAKAA